MTTLDHRILIPSPPHGVWEYISNLENNPQWQVDCEAITYLSQKRKGVGARWRQRSSNRQEYVFEVSTWYDGLGYEYVLIDGSPFKSVRGRIRLQEIPEGTIVQWSFSYELGGGVLGEIRNALTTERRQDSIMVDSLKSLWKQAKRMGSLAGYEARSAVRDGLQDPTDRAQFTSRRNKPTLEEANPTLAEISEPASPIASMPITEPPISDEDTKPRQSAVAAAQILANDAPETNSASTDEHARFAPPATPEPETAFTPASENHETPATYVPDVQPETSISPDVTEPPTETASVTMSEEPAFADKSQSGQAEDLVEPQQPLTPEPTQSEATPSAPPPGADTSEMSIWEVFGIPSPTDTQRMRAIAAAEEAEAEYSAEVAAEQIADDSASVASLANDETIPNAPSLFPTSQQTPPVDEGDSSREGLRSRFRRRKNGVRRPS